MKVCRHSGELTDTELLWVGELTQSSGIREHLCKQTKGSDCICKYSCLIDRDREDR